MYKVIKARNHGEWLAARTKGIGSSEVATLMGVNHFQTKLQLYNLKMGLAKPVEENQLMLLGHLCENAVATLFANETKAHIIKESAKDWIAYDVDEPYLRCSPDRIYWKYGDKHTEANKCILECKTTQMDINADEPPFYWFCQLQYQMGIMGIKEGELAWLIRGRDFGHKHFYFDQTIYDLEIEAIRDFVTNHLDKQIPPQPETAEDVKVMYPKEFVGKIISGKELVCVNPEAEEEQQCRYSIMQVIREIKAIKEHIDGEKMRLDQLQDAVKLAMKDAEAVTVEENGIQKIVATWKAAKDSMKFNAKRFEKEHPEAAQPYMEINKGIRRFLVK